MPTLICDPRDLRLRRQALAAQGRKIDLVYRRVLINDIFAQPAECDALVKAYEARAVCVANTFRCKIPHKKAFFAVLTDERNRRFSPAGERELDSAAHSMDARGCGCANDSGRGSDRAARLCARAARNFVLKPNDEYGGAGVMLGWEWSGRVGSRARAGCGCTGGILGGAGEDCCAARSIPVFRTDGKLTMRDMLVDFAPYLFRGKLCRIFDAVEFHRPGECYVRWWAGAFVCGKPQSGGVMGAIPNSSAA